MRALKHLQTLWQHHCVPTALRHSLCVLNSCFSRLLMMLLLLHHLLIQEHQQQQQKVLRLLLNVQQQNSNLQERMAVAVAAKRQLRHD